MHISCTKSFKYGMEYEHTLLLPYIESYQMIEIFLPFVTAVLVILVIPGPDMALVVANGVHMEKKGAFFSSLGISVGGMVLTLATAIIVATAVYINSYHLESIKILQKMNKERNRNNLYSESLTVRKHIPCPDYSL